MNIAVAGSSGSFSHAAGQLYSAGHEHTKVEYVFALDSAGVLTAVQQHQASIGIMPIYNMNGGLVKMTLEAMEQLPFHVTEWFYLPVQQCLLALPNAVAKNIHTITSHHQALAQCQNYLQQHWSHCEQKEYIDTAEAAKDLASGKLSPDTAVIAPKICADIYHLQLLAENIQDDTRNDTMFLVVESKSVVTEHCSVTTDTANNLTDLRQSIDAIDEQIVQLIGERFQLVRKIKAVKQTTKTEVLDPQREAKVLLRLNELSHKYTVPLEVITHIYDFLMSESRKMQDR